MDVTAPTRLLDNYVGGEWTPATSSDSLDVTNPATGGTLAGLVTSRESLDVAGVHSPPT